MWSGAKRIRRRRMATLLGAALLGGAAPLPAQRWAQPVGVAAHVSAHLPAPSLTIVAVDDREPPTTVSQRYAVGLACALLSGWTVLQSGGREDMALAAYLAGSAGGVILAGHSREGARPVPVILGTMLGATPIWLALADTRPSDGPDHRLLLFFMGIFTAPLGGAMGHDAF